MFEGINLVAVLAAAVAAFVFGAVWYGALGKIWMKAAGLSEADARPKPGIMALTFLCQLVIAVVLAGIVFHTGQTTVKAGLISAFLVWSGFILTTQVVNHRFQKAPWSLTLVDCGHWLGVLLIQGIVIGLMGV